MGRKPRDRVHKEKDKAGRSGEEDGDEVEDMEEEEEKKADIDEEAKEQVLDEKPKEADKAPTTAATGGEASLDAFGKGGKGDGKCRVCLGEGHFARDCPSVEPVSPQAVECHGCHGRGHYKGQCPTANPHLKVAKGQWGGGKGYGRYGWPRPFAVAESTWKPAGACKGTCRMRFA